MNNTVLVIAAHPDDEILGCGGTIAKHLKDGDKVHCVILAEGITSRDIRDEDKKKNLDTLKNSVISAHRLLGTTTLEMENISDNRMDSLDLLDIVKIVEKYLAKYQPQIMYTHHSGDLNIDHRLTSQAAVTAARPLVSPVKTLLFFEVASSTEWQTPQANSYFMPNWFVDISSTLTLKIDVLKAYMSEMKPWPHPRSLRGVEYLARWRGCTAGVDAAEAFNLGRIIK